MAYECEKYLDTVVRYLETGFFEAAYEKAIETIKCSKDNREFTKALCNELIDIYSKASEIYRGQRDWYSSGQILFDIGRINILCNNFRDAANFFIKAGENFANSAILFRQTATSYIFGLILTKKFGDRKDFDKILKTIKNKLNWEIERYELLRDLEQLAQTYDDFSLLYFLLEDYEKVIEFLLKSAKNYEKLSLHYKKMAALRYSLIAVIQRELLNKIGWSKYNKIAHRLFIESGEPMASSIELLKVNLYFAADEEGIREMMDIIEKFVESDQFFAATTLLLSTIIVAMKNNIIFDEMIDKTFKILKLCNDVKLLEFFKVVFVFKYLKPLEVDYLGKYKLVGDDWVRIW